MAVTIIINLPKIPLDLINELWVSATQYPEFDSFFPMHPTSKRLCGQCLKESEEKKGMEMNNWVLRQLVGKRKSAHVSLHVLAQA